MTFPRRPGLTYCSGTGQPPWTKLYEPEESGLYKLVRILSVWGFLEIRRRRGNKKGDKK